MKPDESLLTSRRGFLKVLTAGGAAAGLLTMASTEVLADAPKLNQPQSKPKAGYHETDHIRSYYDSLR
ncbi:hypothetical protein BTE48_14415 [Oceanospirillum multiglobuliferum]|uniref:Formate dehydrogenase n=1 Tax=Oceanospirillum multiglobuliferum TaxID=64969 RepID=A0A1V4T3B3_9GAMM|nr:hypothetical protein BTE48_14415 [Oceanospirillum multiglobuliferum]